MGDYHFVRVRDAFNQITKTQTRLFVFCQTKYVFLYFRQTARMRFAIFEISQIIKLSQQSFTKH